ncbi:MAG: hypothetical protein WDZ91_00355 [Paenibacillaceae bacterium]
MLRILAQLAKWILIFCICFILLSFHWIALVVFVVFLVWRGNVKRRMQYESTVKANAEFVNEHSEEFEVIGVTDINEDGKNRQDIFMRCYRGDTVTLEFQPTEDRPHVVEVWTKFGMIGYLAPYDVAKHIGFFKSTESPTGVIKKLTGGTLDKPELGCIVAIYLTLNEPDEPAEKQPHLNVGLI